jgi:orotidine-5'-phosphate decarboxylase
MTAPSRLRRIRVADVLSGSAKFDGSPYVADCRSADIPETIAGLIRNAAPGLVAVSLRPMGGARMVVTAERAARRRGARIIWIMPPKGWPLVDDEAEERGR